VHFRERQVTSQRSAQTIWNAVSSSNRLQRIVCFLHILCNVKFETAVKRLQLDFPAEREIRSKKRILDARLATNRKMLGVLGVLRTIRRFSDRARTIAPSLQLWNCSYFLFVRLKRKRNNSSLVKFQLHVCFSSDILVMRAFFENSAYRFFTRVNVDWKSRKFVQNKARADKHRQDVTAKYLKQTHAQRQEAAQLKKEEKAKALKEKMMSETDPEKQRKLDVSLGSCACSFFLGHSFEFAFLAFLILHLPFVLYLFFIRP